MISPQSGQQVGRLAFLTKFKGFDLMSSLNIIIGILAVIILLIGAWIFVFFVYKPLFATIEQVSVNRPGINHTLLDKLSAQARQSQEILTSPLSQQYNSPFR